MAKEAERLLDSTGWLPEPLRLAGAEPAVAEPAGEAEALPDFLASEEDAAADPEEAEQHAIAAE
jgi:ParB family chromosome partitioning protein